MKIRTASPADLDALLKLYKHLNPDDEPVSHAKAQQVMTTIDSSSFLKILIGEVGDNLVASCYLNIIPNLTRGCSEYAIIENVVSHKDHRRRGYGKQLMEEALSCAWQSGCYKVMLLTGSKKAIPFYLACGFKSDEKHGLVVRRPR